MSVWKQLEHDLTQWLQACATDLIIYRNPNQAIAGFPSDGFRSDGMLTDGRTLIAIEVEAGQMHPDTNVGKYWLLHQAYRPYERIILFHIYTPDFNSYGWRLHLCYWRKPHVMYTTPHHSPAAYDASAKRRRDRRSRGRRRWLFY